MGLLDDLLPGGWPGLLNTPTGSFPRQGGVAPFLIPPMPGPYGEPIEPWQANPSPIGQAIRQSFGDLAARATAADARSTIPEAPDHGLAERQRLSPLQKAINPITSYPETYSRMNREARDQFSTGIDQLMHPPAPAVPDRHEGDYTDPRDAWLGQEVHGQLDAARGIGNVASGGVGYIASPVSAAYRSLIGQPVEDITGLPREYSELAAQSLTPAIGLRPTGRPAVRRAPALADDMEARWARRSASQAEARDFSTEAEAPTLATPKASADGVASLSDADANRLTGPMPQLASRYPETGSPSLEFDEARQKLYLLKQYSAEERELEAVIKAAQKDIDAKHFDEFFPLSERYRSNPADFPPATDTRNIRPARASTQARAEDRANNPESIQRIRQAFQEGLKQKENAANASALGQVEEKFIEEYGPEEGRRLFKKRIADGIAVTSAGTNSRANFLLAQYANYLETRGASFPTRGYQVPYPAATKFGTSNLKQYRKLLIEGTGITPANPKIYNYSNDILGGNGGVIDRHVSRLFDPKMTAPPPGTYGNFESVLAKLAAEHGVDLSFFKDMVWAGARKHPTDPVMAEINASIERTHRVTGMPREEIVRRGLVRAEIPMFGIAGSLLLKGGEDPEDNLQQ